jgi:hypothetical protein
MEFEALVKRANDSKSVTSPAILKAICRLTQRKKASKLPRIAEIAQKLGKKIPEAERRVIPQDFSSRPDHYIYGSTKR